MSELQGQMDMGAMLANVEPQAPADIEGYDENGVLLDYTPDIYGAMDAGEADRLRYLAAGIRSDYDGARERVLHMGMLLMEARNRCPRGRWRQWLEKEARCPERTAQQAMQLYETYGARELPENVSISHLVELLRAPEADRDSLMKKAAEEGLSTRELKAEVRRLREDRQKDQVKIHDLIVENEGAARKMAQMSEAVNAANAEAAKAAGRAEDAVARANKSDESLRKAKDRIRALEERGPETVEVERVPDDVSAELERLKAENETLRNGRPRSPLVEQFVYLFKRFNAAFEELMDTAMKIKIEDADKSAQCKDSLRKLLDGMRSRLGV